MSFSVTVLQSVTGAAALVEASKAYTGTILLQVEEVVADSETDLEIVAALDVSEIDAIIILSDQIVTFEVNDGAAPDDTISLVANVPYLETSDSYFVSLLTTDWTSVFITNASGSAATIKILALSDATP